MRDELNNILAKHTGQDVEKINNDTDRDNFMTAEDAKEYGLIDDVIVSRADVSKNGSGIEKKGKEDDK